MYGPRLKDRLEGVSSRDWKKEIAERAGNYHIIGAYVAVVFDPLFGITDYFNIPQAWQQVFLLRIAIAAITAVGIWLYKKNRIGTYMLVAIPLALISFQNAYTYRFIQDAQVLGHNLNYIALFLGASLFLIWPIRYSLIATGFSILTTLWFVSSNSEIDLRNFAVEGGLLLLTSSIFTVLMIQGRYRLKVKEVKALLALEDSLSRSERQGREISRQNELLIEQSSQLETAKGEIDLMNAELSEANKGLEAEVKRRTQRLEETNKEMEQLVYSLSHDFRSPMVNAKGLVEVAKSMEPSSYVNDVLERIAECLNRFDALLHDMMNYAVYWDKELVKTAVGIKNVLDNVWRDLEHDHKNGLLLDVAGVTEGTVWYSHPEKMRVLLYCVLSNSVRFQKEKIVGRIEIRLLGTTDGTELTIKDYGIGIPNATLERVFDMYYRGSNASRGAGLGLYIAKGIITQMGGEINLSSKENEWTEVRLTWPNKVLSFAVT